MGYNDNKIYVNVSSDRRHGLGLLISKKNLEITISTYITGQKMSVEINSNFVYLRLNDILFLYPVSVHYNLMKSICLVS